MENEALTPGLFESSSAGPIFKSPHGGMHQRRAQRAAARAPGARAQHVDRGVRAPSDDQRCERLRGVMRAGLAVEPKPA